MLVNGGAKISATTFGKSNAGDLTIKADSVEAISESADGQFASVVCPNRDLQYPFKESVEPVYRESVALLLRSQQTNQKSNQNVIQ